MSPLAPAAPRALGSTSLRDLAADLDDALAIGMDAFWDCGARLRALLEPAAFGDLVHAALEDVAAAPDAVPVSGPDSWTIASGERFRLIGRAFREGVPISRRLVHGMAEHLLLGVAGPGTLTVDVHEEAPGQPNDVFDRRRALGPAERRSLAPGDVAAFHAGRHAILPDTPRCTTFVLLLLSAPVQPFQWVYDAATGAPERLESADPTASRLELTARLLGELGSGASATTLAKLASHSSHAVRWVALQAWVRIDLRAGLAAVRDALHDPHPHVRRAAAKALAQADAAGLST